MAIGTPTVIPNLGSDTRPPHIGARLHPRRAPMCLRAGVTGGEHLAAMRPPPAPDYHLHPRCPPDLPARPRSALLLPGTHEPTCDRPPACGRSHASTPRHGTGELPQHVRPHRAPDADEECSADSGAQTPWPDGCRTSSPSPERSYQRCSPRSDRPPPRE